MWIAFSFNFLHIISLVCRHLIYFKWLLSKNLITRYDNLRTTGYWKIIMGEIFFQVLIPYPFLNDLVYYETNGRWKATNVKIKINHVLLALMTFTRIYQIIKALLLITYWTAPRAQRICWLNGCHPDYLFAVKAIMKEKPYQFLLISLLISVLQLGYCLRIFERYFTSYSNQNFDLMSNTIWNVIITMTTVGYGDIYPKTVMGRVIGGIVSLWGLFLVSIFTVTLSNLFTFSEGELKAYKLGERLRIKDQLKVTAANVLGSSFKQMKAKKVFANEPEAIKNFQNDYKRNSIYFYQTLKQVRESTKDDSEINHMKKEIEDLLKKIQEMES